MVSTASQSRPADLQGIRTRSERGPSSTRAISSVGTLLRVARAAATSSNLPARAGKFDEVAAALATLNNVPTELMARVLEGPRSDLVLIPCKSAGLDWLAVETILRHRPVAQPIGEKSIWQANLDYGRLSRETAQRTIR